MLNSPICELILKMWIDLWIQIYSLKSERKMWSSFWTHFRFSKCIHRIVFTKISGLFFLAPVKRSSDLIRLKYFSASRETFPKRIKGRFPEPTSLPSLNYTFPTAEGWKHFVGLWWHPLIAEKLSPHPICIEIRLLSLFHPNPFLYIKIMS